jgi:hypothetical protein
MNGFIPYHQPVSDTTTQIQSASQGIEPWLCTSGPHTNHWLMWLTFSYALQPRFRCCFITSCSSEDAFVLVLGYSFHRYTLLKLPLSYHNSSLQSVFYHHSLVSARFTRPNIRSVKTLAHKSGHTLARIGTTNPTSELTCLSDRDVPLWSLSHLNRSAGLNPLVT